MPSACTKAENKASTEASSSIEKCLMVVEKKVRNLEKRKGKLDAYRAKQDGGETLNDDQEDAISKYDAVIQNLDLARDLQKQFQAISNDLEKLLKKKAKREKAERQEQEIARFKEVLKLQDLLSNMGCDEVRDHFKLGSSGAVKLKNSDLEQLDELYKLITPTREADKSYSDQLTLASEHLSYILEGREKEVHGMSGTTYKQLKELVDSIHESGYFDKLTNKEEDVPEEIEASEPEEQSIPIQEPELVETTEQPVSVAEVVPTLPTAFEAVVPVAESPIIVPVIISPNAPVSSIPSEPHIILEDDSFFSTAQYQNQPRALQDIVSSVQGNFNFLQDSEIEDGYALAQAHAQQNAFQNTSLLSSGDQTGSPSTYNQQIVAQSVSDMTSQHAASQQISQTQHTDLNSLDFGAAAPSMVENTTLQFGAVDSIVGGHESQSASSLTASSSSQQQAALDSGYNQTYSQNLMSQSMGASSSSQHYADQSPAGHMSSHITGLQKATDSLGSASAIDVPQPIPLPNETLPGQSLISPAFSADSANAAAAQQQEKKAYTMNPNADPFQSSHIFNQRNMSSMSGQSASAGSSSAIQQASSHHSSSAIQQASSHHSSSAASAAPSTASTAVLGPDESHKSWQSNVSQQQSQQQQQQESMDYQSGSNRGGRGTSRGRGGMNNGFPRGGNRGSSSYGSGRGGSYNSGGRGGSRGGGGAWQGYPPRGDYRPEGGYQGFNNGYSNSGNMAASSNRMRGGGSARGGGVRGARGNSSGFGRPSNPAY